jgi:hypothetical protein
MFLKKSSIPLVLLSVFFISCWGSYDDITGLYTNRGKGFSINFPDEWKKIKAQMGALVTVSDPNELAQISIVVQELPEETTLDKYFKTISSQGKRMGARVKDSGEMTIDEADALWSMMNIKVGGGQFTSLNYYVMNKNRVYSIICIADSVDFNDFENEFDAAVESFKFID